MGADSKLRVAFCHPDLGIGGEHAQSSAAAFVNLHGRSQHRAVANGSKSLCRC
jgi:hypothetical protein